MTEKTEVKRCNHDSGCGRTAFAHGLCFQHCPNEFLIEGVALPDRTLSANERLRILLRRAQAYIYGGPPRNPDQDRESALSADIRAELDSNAPETEAGATCKWTEIEEGTGKFNTCKPGESFHLTQGMDLYPFCHWCGREIEVTDDSYIHGPGTFPHSDGCLCSKCKPENGEPHELKASEQRTAAEEWENAKAVMSGEMPPCECTLRDKAPSAYHNAKCPRYVADKL